MAPRYVFLRFGVRLTVGPGCVADPSVVGKPGENENDCASERHYLSPGFGARPAQRKLSLVRAHMNYSGPELENAPRQLLRLTAGRTKP